MTREEWDAKLRVIERWEIARPLMMTRELFGERPGPPHPGALVLESDYPTLQVEVTRVGTVGDVGIGVGPQWQTIDAAAAVCLRDWLNTYIEWKEQA